MSLDTLDALGSAAGGAAGLIGLVVAWRATRRANTADQAATRAAAAAENSNQIAGQALKLAQSAEDRADRLEALARERSDVRWERVDAHETQRVTWRHVGTDPALDVHLILDVTGGAWANRQDLRYMAVAPGEPIGQNLSSEASAAQVAQLPADADGMAAPAQVVRVGATITWQTPAGASETFDAGTFDLFRARPPR